MPILKYQKQQWMCLLVFKAKRQYSAIISMLNAPDAKIRNIGIDLVGRKRMTDALPQLVKMTSDQDETVRQSALKRVGELGSVSDIVI
jgi:HEAT repeat protein